MRRIYLCSMGANIAPEKNFAKAREHLTELGEAHYSRAIYTQPVAMQSEHQFLNALFVFETQLDAVALKNALNSIEIALGRDRSDPMSSQKDRPMDIDIVGEFSDNAQNHEVIWQHVPEYLQTVTAPLKPLASKLQQQSECPHE